MGIFGRRGKLVAGLTALALAGCVKQDIIMQVPQQYRIDVEKAFQEAGQNASELRDTLEEFRSDKEKLEAASFLVSETSRRMHRRHPVDWTWDLAHKDYTEIPDAHVVKSEDLIDNINWAFVARDRFPWAKELYDRDRPLFFSGVLPYRLGTASLEQLPGINGHWRAMLLDEKVFDEIKQKYGLKMEFSVVSAKLDEIVDAYRSAQTIPQKDAALARFMEFVEIDFMAGEGLRYFPRGPEEKTLGNFLTPDVKDGQVRRGGRCTDGDNNSRYLYMGVGIPTSSIRFIAWPNGDDNHEVIRILLPGEPFDMSTCIFSDRAQDVKYVPGKVGKVYEERWGTRDVSSELVWNLNEGEKLPWYIGFYLRTRSTIDVTDRYGPTGDIKIETSRPGQLIYLGVMNNNSDTQLGTATIAIDRANETGLAEFNKVGNDGIFYIPYTYDELNGGQNARAVGLPFVLRRDGSERRFGSGINTTSFPSTLNDLERGRNYELLRFSGEGWILRSKINGGNDGTADVNLSNSAVSGLRSQDNGKPKYSRPFALTEGKVERF